jgi:hypothetical protein
MPHIEQLYLLTSIALGSACASPRPEPAPAPPPPVASASARPHAVAAKPRAPSTAAPEAPPAPSLWHEVLSAAYPDVEVAAFDGGAVLAARSFLVVASGDRVRQDPGFLAALPEWINWDASIYVAIPNPRSPLASGLPRGMELSAHAGNLHGPDFGGWWNGPGWTTRPLPPDPRRQKLPPAGQFVDETSLSFGSGDLLVVRFDQTVESFHVTAKAAKPLRTTIPIASPGYRHALVGNGSRDAYLCEAAGAIYHYDGKAWSQLSTDFAVTSCAVTSDGTLWAVTDGDARVVRERAGAWADVPPPEGAKPVRIIAAGTRAWLVAEREHGSAVYSSEPVAEPVRVDERDLPGPLYVDGITGLDVSSVDVASVSAAPAGPGTRACTSLVAWLGPTLTPELRKALGPAPPQLVEVAGVKPGQVVPAGSGSQMRVQPSGQKRSAVAALPAGYDEGAGLVAAVNTVLPKQGARLLCAAPRIVRTIK